MRSPARLTFITLFHLTGMLLPVTSVAQSALFEVETRGATKLLRVADDGGFLVTGAREIGAIPATGEGVRLMWYPAKWALRAGYVSDSRWDEANIGDGSVGLGLDAKASGTTSLAWGQESEASGDFSTAGGLRARAEGPAAFAAGHSAVASGTAAVGLGHLTLASGDFSLSAGVLTQATGSGSTALGAESVAAGGNSLAVGYRARAAANASLAAGTGAVAEGAASVALGSAVTAKGNGSFVFGDRNIDHGIVTGANQFAVRAHGGVYLFTGTAAGCHLPENSGAWSCSSSKRLKEDFQDVDGEEVLAGLKAIPIQSWRYIGTSTRHIGPFAEDFHAAFGVGDGPDRIAQIDADGIALSAVQALERRTAELREENAALRAELAALRSDLEKLTVAGGVR